MDGNIDFSFLAGLNKTDNINKYASKNPFIKLSVNSFVSSLLDLIEICNNEQIRRVLDAGTGEGVLNHIIQEKFKYKIFGLDISLENLNIANQIVEDSLIRGNIYDLPFKNDSMDLVISLEVLEHLTEPEDAISEIERVTGKFAILSVPNDCLFRIGNIFRGKNLLQLGKDPGHVQHFTTKSFIELIEKHFKIITIKKPANVWLMCLLVKS